MLAIADTWTFSWWMTVAFWTFASVMTIVFIGQFLSWLFSPRENFQMRTNVKDTGQYSVPRIPAKPGQKPPEPRQEDHIKQFFEDNMES